MIEVKFKISNLAPITSIDKSIQLGSIDVGFFARNGCGKTYISRIFELLSSRESDDYNRFIKKGETKCDFEFSVDNVENIKLQINKDITPLIPETQFIYHVFNEDYTERHYKENYNKNGNIEGVILGKEKKAVDDKIQEIKKSKIELQKLLDFLVAKINEEYNNELSKIPYLTRLKEYNDWINIDYIKKNYISALSSSYDLKFHIDAFNKLSTIPENIQGVSTFKTLHNDLASFLNSELLECLHHPYTLAELGADFRKKIIHKEDFIKSGIKLLTNNECPFCERPLDDVQDLISKYNKYIEDTENKVKTYLIGTKDKLSQKTIDFNQNQKVHATFIDYKEKYIPNYKDELELIDVSIFDNIKNKIIEIINLKIKDIRESKNADFNEIINYIESYNVTIEKNNLIIRDFNKILENSNAQKQKTKREIVNNFYFYFCSKYQNELRQISKHYIDLEKSNIELIELKKEAKTIKKVVGETTKQIIKKFFGDKYSFNPISFKLSFNNSELTENEPKKILSQGERSLLTFAYYLGETHQKIKQDESNYNKLFFIIDDPISSLDFENVFSVADIIKDLDKIFNLEHKRLFVFTHNFEFIRKLKSNKAIKQSYEICCNSIRKLQGNLSLDYYSHLNDIYKMSINGGNSFHTIGNSIRHVLEGMAKFENPKIEQNITKDYIAENEDIKLEVSNTLIQDLSHGNPFSDNSFGNDEWIKLCTNVTKHILIKYPRQIDYLKTLNE